MNIFYILCFLLSNLITKNQSKFNSDLVGQNSSFLVSPNQTDPGYNASDNSHYVVKSSLNQVNKLMIFIGGSFSSPDDYYIFCNYAASSGLDVISLSYPNNVATANLGTSNDPLIFDNYRQEICFGTPVSNVVSVDNLNAIQTRIIKLLQYLHANDTNHDWNQYLINGSTINWANIILSGHSQGSGHAAYLAKYNEVERVLMFSGPNDYSTFFDAPANWLIQPGATSISKHFALLHFQDEIVPFTNQYANLEGLGMLVNNTPTLVDNLNTPYNNSHFLYINTPAISYHNSTLGNNAILPSVWHYMLFDNTALGFSNFQNTKDRIIIYPNPVNDIINFKYSKKIVNVQVIDCTGKIIKIIQNNISLNQLNFIELQTGVYSLKIKDEDGIMTNIKFFKN